MSKMFVITDCKFELPDSFDGTCGEALMILAEYRLSREWEQGVTAIREDISTEEKRKLLEKNKDENCCVLTYGFKEGRYYDE